MIAWLRGTCISLAMATLLALVTALPATAADYELKIADARFRLNGEQAPLRPAPDYFGPGVTGHGLWGTPFYHTQLIYTVPALPAGSYVLGMPMSGFGYVAIPEHLAKRVQLVVNDRHYPWTSMTEPMLPENAAEKTRYQAELRVDTPVRLKPGDVVLSLNGKDIRDGGALRNTVANTPIGTLIKLTIWRDKREQEITVMVGNLDDAFKAITDALRERLGATFRPLKPAEASNLGIDPSVGVVVGRLDAKGPLARVGFEVGDVVLGVNGQQIDSVETLAALIDSLPHNHRVSLFAMDHNSRRAGNVVIEVR